MGGLTAVREIVAAAALKLRRQRLAVIAVAGIIVFSALGAVLWIIFFHSTTPPLPSDLSDASTSEAIGRPLNLQALANKARGAVVFIVGCGLLSPH